MVNPLLTVLFDLFLVGSAIAIVAAMVQEYFDSRTPSIGGDVSARGPQPTAHRQSPEASRIRQEHLKRVA